MQIKKLEFLSLGIENQQYFQGAGVSCTRWDDVYIGIGNTENEAAEDSIQQAIESGCDYDWNSISTKEFDETIEVPEALGLESWDDCDEAHFYVALYVKFYELEEEDD